MSLNIFLPHPFWYRSFTSLFKKEKKHKPSFHFTSCQAGIQQPWKLMGTLQPEFNSMSAYAHVLIFKCIVRSKGKKKKKDSYTKKKSELSTHSQRDTEKTCPKSLYLKGRKYKKNVQTLSRQGTCFWTAARNVKGEGLSYCVSTTEQLETRPGTDLQFFMISEISAIISMCLPKPICHVWLGRSESPEDICEKQFQHNHHIKKIKPPTHIR